MLARTKVIAPLLFFINTHCVSVNYADNIRFIEFKPYKSRPGSHLLPSKDCFSVLSPEGDEFSRMLGAEPRDIKNLSLEGTSVFLLYGWTDCYQASEAQK